MSQKMTNINQTSAILTAIGAIRREVSQKVTNINGTSANRCECVSWLEHWKNFSGGGTPASCSEEGCTEKPEFGAHVQRAGSTDRSWYIVPLCRRHNETAGPLEIKASVKPVSANVSGTCGRALALARGLLETRNSFKLV